MKNVVYNRLMLTTGRKNFVARALNKAKSYIYIYIGKTNRLDRSTLKASE